MEAYALESPHPAFDGSWELFGAVVSFLDGPQAAELSHADLEDRLEVDVRKVICRLYQDHLEVRAQRERRLSAVVDADGVVRERAEVGRERGLATVFGEVRVRRVAYRQAGHGDLHPADAGLNLPAEKHSHGLRRLAAVESVRGSFADAADAIERTTGQRLGKRQVEQLTGRAAADFDAFYASRRRHLSPAGAVLALTFDGKGVVMRPDGLRPATAKAAGRSRHKLATRLSKGEKRNRKRMAEVGAVYDVVPVPRTAEDILSDPGTDRPRTAGPKATNKWRTASVVADAATVIAEGFDEADRRDPHHTRTWVALVDGNAHQIDRIRAEADARGVAVTIVADFVHVIEYVSAPRGARLYPPLSGERLEEVSLGLMAYLDSKEKGDNSMPANQRPCPGVWGGALGDPRDMAKAKLPEPQLPEGASRTPAGKTPETGAVPCTRSHRCLAQSSGARSDAQSGHSRK